MSTLLQILEEFWAFEEEPDQYAKLHQNKENILWNRFCVLTGHVEDIIEATVMKERGCNLKIVN